LWPAASHEVRRFAKQLSGFDIRVVVYCRNYIEFARSAYQQAVKGTYSKSFDKYLSENLWLFDYAKILRTWGADFGPENVCMRIYDKVKNSLISDFLKVSGIEFSVNGDLTVRRNVSPPDSAALLLSRMNAFENTKLSRRTRVAHKIRRHIITSRGAGPALSFVAKLFCGSEIVRDEDREFLKHEISEMRDDFLKEFVSPNDWRYFEF
jgi:hypothetical protein